MSYNVPIKTLVAFAKSGALPYEGIIDILEVLEENNRHDEIFSIHESIFEDTSFLISYRLRSAAHILSNPNLNEFYKANILDRVLKLSNFYNLTSSDMNIIDSNLYDYLEKTA